MTAVNNLYDGFYLKLFGVTITARGHLSSCHLNVSELLSILVAIQAAKLCIDGALSLSSEQ